MLSRRRGHCPRRDPSHRSSCSAQFGSEEVDRGGCGRIPQSGSHESRRSRLLLAHLVPPPACSTFHLCYCYRLFSAGNPSSETYKESAGFSLVLTKGLQTTSGWPDLTHPCPLRVPKCLLHSKVPCLNCSREEGTPETCPHLCTCLALPLSWPRSPAEAASRKAPLDVLCGNWFSEAEALRLGLGEEY